MGNQEGPELCRFSQGTLTIGPQDFNTGYLDAVHAQKDVNELQRDRFGAHGKNPDIPCGPVNNQKVADKSLTTLNELRLWVCTPVVNLLQVLWAAEKADVHLVNLARLEGIPGALAL